MGALHSATNFVSMMIKLQNKWDTLAKEHELRNFALKIIVDDVLMYGHIAGQILAYFRMVVDFLKHHFPTIKMKKWK